MRRLAKLILEGKLLLIMLLLSGCGLSQQDPTWDISYSEFTKGLASVNGIAKITAPNSDILTSHDRSGGNDDFSYFQEKAEDGWYVVADLKGPGYVSRFWTTGGAREDKRLRFFFDGERKPRIDATIAELRRGDVPFIDPLSAYEQSCWYSYVPITYEKSLKILMSWDGTGKRYYHVNSSSLPADRAVESFPKKFSDADVEAVKELAQFCEDYANRKLSSTGSSHSVSVTVPPGKTIDAISIKGPAIIENMEFEIENEPGLTAVGKERVLRRLFLQVEWDNSGVASVYIPLAAVGGEIWNCPSYQSICFGKSNSTYSCRFPMPYRKSAVVRILNLSDTAVKIHARTVSKPLVQYEEGLGYFHAVWNRSLPSDVGRPHAVLQAKGQGKYVGCVLGSSSMDKSWWLLESDESIRKDHEFVAGWQGTGLEDYFNGGWYYKNNLVRPLHGLIFKVPFQTIQYRIHHNDAPRFNSSVDVSFERGPDNLSHGLMESVAFYYLKNPSEVIVPGGLSDSSQPADTLEKTIIMQTLCNYERLGDYKGASRYIDLYLERYPDVGFEQILRLRQIAYIERVEGFRRAEPLYRAFVKRNDDKIATSFANLFLWYHAGADRAILTANCSNPSGLFLDGKKVGSLSSPSAFGVFPVTLRKGNHLLAIETAKLQYPDWVQACLLTHECMVMTGRDMKYSLDFSSDYKFTHYNDASWPCVEDVLREGPPPLPHVLMSPHPMVDMHSLPKAVWGGKRGQQRGDKITFRKSFKTLGKDE